MEAQKDPRARDESQAQKRRLAFSGVYLLVAASLLWLLHGLILAPEKPELVSYSELLGFVREGRVTKAQIEDARILAELEPAQGEGKPRRVVATRLPRVEERFLVEELEAKGVEITGVIEELPWWLHVLVGWVVPIALLLLLWGWGFQRLGRGPSALHLGGPAKIFDRAKSGRTTFDDVAGYEEVKAELKEIVDFLKSPERYRAIGARMPKGVLLVGPPGTGKTLLARAVAGEADVPFFSVSGSEFVEMFVGVGAARMRRLFEQAKQRAPCIVFIDEIDAIGKSRGGVGALATHDEREQTLNQLLVEMDGFEENSGVILMAATNRPSVLDPALLRAGRFDRQILVDRPDKKGREAILQVHARRLKLSGDVRLDVIARRTAGMAGADLANIVNEAALAAARRRSSVVEQQDFDEGLDRVQLGLKKSGAGMTDEERRRVAVHEAGHALVALSLPRADPVHRVSILPRSVGTLGVTLQLPAAERHLMTRAELQDRLCVLLGGRTAEALLTGDVSTGASNDLERATETARQMVCRFGMSDALGPVTYGKAYGEAHLSTPVSFEERNFSEETARAIDVEVRRLVEEAADKARALLEKRRGALAAIVEELLAKETLDRAELDAILERSPLPSAKDGAAPGLPAAG